MRDPSKTISFCHQIDQANFCGLKSRLGFKFNGYNITISTVTEKRPKVPNTVNPRIRPLSIPLLIRATGPPGPLSHVFKIGANTFSIIIRSPNNYAVTTITGVTVIGTSYGKAYGPTGPTLPCIQNWSRQPLGFSPPPVCLHFLS